MGIIGTLQLLSEAFESNKEWIDIRSIGQSRKRFKVNCVENITFVKQIL